MQPHPSTERISTDNFRQGPGTTQQDAKITTGSGQQRGTEQRKSFSFLRGYGLHSTPFAKRIGRKAFQPSALPSSEATLKPRPVCEEVQVLVVSLCSKLVMERLEFLHERASPKQKPRIFHAGLSLWPCRTLLLYPYKFWRLHPRAHKSCMYSGNSLHRLH